MRKFDVRILVGVALLVLGGLMFVEKLGFLQGAASIFWGGVFVFAGGAFGLNFLQNARRNWWAIIPALALLGLGVQNFLPESLQGLSGMIFLGALGLSFMVIYATDRLRWWGLIPGGILVTLAAVSGVEQYAPAMETGSIFFIGLGLTFLLVAALPNPLVNTRWAYFPAVVLVLLGAFFGSVANTGLVNYIWPVALIALGLALVSGFFFRRE